MDYPGTQMHNLQPYNTVIPGPNLDCNYTFMPRGVNFSDSRGWLKNNSKICDTIRLSLIWQETGLHFSACNEWTLGITYQQQTLRIFIQRIRFKILSEEQVSNKHSNNIKCIAIFITIFLYYYVYGCLCNTSREKLTFAVRETLVSRHNGGPIVGPLKPPVHHSTLLYWGA